MYSTAAGRVCEQKTTVFMIPLDLGKVCNKLILCGAQNYLDIFKKWSRIGFVAAHQITILLIEAPYSVLSFP
jgi:hypothetical protein